MKILQRSVLLLAVFILQGCFSSNHYYILSVASNPSHTYPSHNLILAVKKVTIPAYLYKREIAIAASSSKIILLPSSQWGEDLDTGLTNRIIGFLQKKFKNPHVYPYPWGLNTQADIKISIQVTRFIAENNSVYLDATWNIEDLKTKEVRAKLYSVRIDTTAEIEDIIKSMDKAMSDFENSIAKGIYQFNQMNQSTKERE
ncbi:MAG: ABC-type transport auxiliary lipoprotein family protein [Sulfurovum sp.]|nr:ABC-type transport auxiliary lipoprotein family protein [Sulfurovum sp.]